jgi:hypothetical protein
LPDDPVTIPPEGAEEAAPAGEADPTSVSSDDATADKLANLINTVAEKSARATAEAMLPAAEDPTTTTSEADRQRAEDYYKSAEERIAEGKAGEVIKELQEQTLGPQAEATREIARSVGESNVDRLRDKFGEKFTKREPLFRSLQRKYKITDEQLAKKEVTDQLWKMTQIEDPKFMEEEVEDRMKRAEEDRRRKLADTPPALAPVTAALVEDTRDEYKELAKDFLADDDETFSYQVGQIHAYFGDLDIPDPVEAYLRQARKRTDPTECYGVGRGKMFRPIWIKAGGKSRVTRKKAS